MTSKNVLKPSLGIHVSRGTWLAGTRFPPVSVCTSVHLSRHLIRSHSDCWYLLFWESVFTSLQFSSADLILIGFVSVRLTMDTLGLNFHGTKDLGLCAYILYILAVSVQLISFLIGFDSAWPLPSLVQAFSKAASTCDHRANINIRKGRPVPVHGHCPPLPLPGTNLAKTLTQGMIKKNGQGLIFGRKLVISCSSKFITHNKSLS